MISVSRFALVCALATVPILRAVELPQTQSANTFENKYVKVVFAPPLVAPPRSISDCFDMDFPFVRVYLPSQVVGPKPEIPGTNRADNVFVGYTPRGAIFMCQGTDHGSTIYIDLKASPAHSVFTDDALKNDPAHNRVLLENDDVRVVRIDLGPGELVPMADERPRVIVAVTDSCSTVTFPDRRSKSRDAKAGAYFFEDAGRETISNTGTTPLEYVVVELKSKKN
jgi:hypothetical protein